VPYIETGHAGPLTLKNINEVIIISVIEDTASIMAALRRAEKEEGDTT
jgi:hypothetical protein